MARIRTIKPEFFRHEELQEAQQEHPELNPMLVFAGLWGQADKKGTFRWLPRTLKLDILPFLAFDMAETLDLLCERGFIDRFVGPDGKPYGQILSWGDHQRITGSEATDPARYPEYQKGNKKETAGKQSGDQEGKGREGNGTDKTPEEKQGGNSGETLGLSVPRETPPDPDLEPTPKGTPRGLSKFQYAVQLAAEVRLPSSGNQRVLTDSLEVVALELKGDLADAYDYLIDTTQRDRMDGVPIDHLYFLNAKFWPANKQVTDRDRMRATERSFTA